MSISKNGLAFVDITYEISFQERTGIPEKDFGIMYALKSKPIYFEYEASDAVSSFSVIEVNHLGKTLSTTALSTSLIVSNGSSHICDGLTDYASDLDCGTYYFLVNSKYRSEYFRVDTQLTEGTLNQPDISVNGLKFFDNNYSVPWQDRIGKPNVFFGIQFADDTYPLYFDYISNDAISSFKAVKVDWLGNDIEEIDLITSLITVTDHHICTGNTAYNIKLDQCVHYFNVNDQYISELFAVAQITPAYYLKLVEGGFFKLVEGGFLKLLS